MTRNELLSILPDDFQEAISAHAGIAVKTHNPDEKLSKETLLQNLMFAVEKGGFNIVEEVEHKNHGDDIANCPPNLKELEEIISRKYKASGTAKTLTAESVQSLLGSCTKSGSAALKFVPTMKLADEDFKDFWVIFPYGTQGGSISMHLKNAYMTSGFNVQTTDDGTASYPFEYSAFATAADLWGIPFELYVKATELEPAQLRAPETAPKGGKA